MSGVWAAPPDTASVVVIGGGVVGVSVAFHLAEAGVKDIVLVERDELGSGSTSRAAGGVRSLFSDELNVRLGMRSLEAFRDFGRRPGHEIEFKEVGYLFLIAQPDHLRAFEDSIALQNRLGIVSRIVDVSEAQQLSPLIDTVGLVGGAWSPADGYCTPESVVSGYAAAARSYGVAIERHCKVVGIETIRDRIAAVVTHRGAIRTNTIICAAGPWSREVGAMVGVELPVSPLRRQVVVTEAIPNLAREMPMTLDFGSTLYFHPEGPGLLIGMSDPMESPGFNVERSDEWLPRLTEAIAARIPSILDVGLRSGWAGLYEMTPDSNALLGEASAVSRFLYATGFSGHGFLQAPAVGEVIRDYYLGRQPFADVSALSAERFGRGELRREVQCV